MPRPTPKLEDRPFSAVRDCLFNLFAATLNIGGRSSIRNTEDAPCRGDRDPQTYTVHKYYFPEDGDTCPACCTLSHCALLAGQPGDLPERNLQLCNIIHCPPVPLL